MRAVDEPIFRGRSGLVVLAIPGVVVVFLVGRAVEPSATTPSAGSTNNSGPDGASIYFEFLARLGYDVEQKRTPAAEDPPDPGATVVVLSTADLPAEEALALEEFARSGGRLVVGGPGSAQLVSGSAQDGKADDGFLLFPHPDLARVRRVESPFGTAWTDPGDALPLVGGADGVLVAFAVVGSGEVFVLATPAILSNRALGGADNAALGVGLAGPPGQRVVFAEYVHASSAGTGIGAIPLRWKWGLAFVALAGLVWLLAHARRLGPPEHRDRVLPPPRVRYVDALALTLERAKEPRAATEPVRDRIRTRLAERGLPTEADDDAAVESAALQLDVTAEDLRTALNPPTGDESVVAAGRVLAALHGGMSGTE